jgi:hypothetical protein
VVKHAHARARRRIHDRTLLHICEAGISRSSTFGRRRLTHARKALPNEDVRSPWAALRPSDRWLLLCARRGTGFPLLVCGSRGRARPLRRSRCGLERRYLNVFFGYRGAALDDATLTRGKQLEDNLTRALAVTLERASGATRRSFAERICRAQVGGAGEAKIGLQPLAGTFDATRRVLLGISVAGRIDTASLDLDQGGSRPDAALQFGTELLILVESKAVAALDGGQLARHAFRWGLEEPRIGPNGVEIPESWVIQGWSSVASWARGAAERDGTRVGSFLLSQLAEYLDLAGVTDIQIARPSTRGTSESRAPVWLTDLAEAADLDAVAAVCSRLYGAPDRRWFIGGSGVPSSVDCRADSRRVAQAYSAAGQPVPPRLLHKGGDVITARRALSILYGPDGYERSVAEPDIHNRVTLLRDVGTDRAVLLGILAWAWDRDGLLADHARQIVGAAWANTEQESLAAPELHETLPERARLALSIEWAS